MRYSIIYADPPWWENIPAKNRKDRKILYAGRDFPVMKTAEICALKVPEICENNAALFLWSTSRHIPDALQVIKAWGFSFRKIVFTWMKLCKDGTPARTIGYYTKSNSEYVLLGVRGRMPPVSHSVPEAVLEARDRVFKKPETVRRRIEELYGNSSRIELFAREKHPGWDVWGNQVSGKELSL